MRPHIIATYATTYMRDRRARISMFNKYVMSRFERKQPAADSPNLFTRFDAIPLKFRTILPSVGITHTGPAVAHLHVVHDRIVDRHFKRQVLCGQTADR
jgi:hypothetical protein